MNEELAWLLETTEAEQLATGLGFTEGPSWHPDGYYYFVDIRRHTLHRIVPGQEPETIRENTGEGNGTTFDLQGRLVICAGGNRRIERYEPDGSVTVLADRYEGKRFNKPNDVVCKSDGTIWFTDPSLRVPIEERELEPAVYRIAPDGTVSLIAQCEYPNGLAFSLDERTLYVANTRHAMYIHAIDLGPDDTMTRRRIFADMSSTERWGVPDGMKLDVEGRVYCTGPAGTWVFDPDGKHRGIIRTPETPANLTFGGPDLRTLFFTARHSIYQMRVKVPGRPHPWYELRKS